MCSFCSALYSGRFQRRLSSQWSKTCETIFGSVTGALDSVRVYWGHWLNKFTNLAGFKQSLQMYHNVQQEISVSADSLTLIGRCTTWTEQHAGHPYDQHMISTSCAGCCFKAGTQEHNLEKVDLCAGEESSWRWWCQKGRPVDVSGQFAHVTVAPGRPVETMPSTATGELLMPQLCQFLAVAEPWVSTRHIQLMQMTTIHDPYLITW